MPSMFQNASGFDLDPPAAPGVTRAVPGDVAITPAVGGAMRPPLAWRSAAAKCSRANFASADATRAEGVMSFGVAGPRDPARGDIEVALGHRLVTNPFAAKRFAGMLDRLIAECARRPGEPKAP